MSEQEHDPIEQSRMTFGEHLDELRTRLIRALVVFLAAFVLCFAYNEELIKLVCRPLFWVLKENNLPPSLFPRAVTEVFFTTLKMSAIAGFVIASPWIMYQIWAFIAAGLYPSEKRIVHTYAPLSMVCFIVGAVFFYMFVLPIALNYFVSFGKDVSFDPSEGKPWAMELLYPTLPEAPKQPAKPIEVKALDPAGKEIVLKIDPSQIRPVVPTLEKDPDDADLRTGMIWINSTSQDLRFAVRATEVDENSWFDKGKNLLFGSELAPVQQKWTIRSVNFQAKSFLAQAFTLGDYVSFVSVMTLVFGAAFQIPLIVLFSIKIGFTDRAYLKGVRKYVLFAVVVIAAIITPTPDPFTQMMLAIPMYLLFELGLILSLFLAVYTPPPEEEEARLAAEDARGSGPSSGGAPSSTPKAPAARKREPEPEHDRSLDDD